MPRHQTTKQGDKKSAAAFVHDAVRQHISEVGKQSLASLHMIVGDIFKLREQIQLPKAFATKQVWKHDLWPG
jgi:hypothetical protein